MSTEKRPIPIGVVDFRKLRENNYFYIDKTLLIKDVFTSGSDVILFTRPRRFGKTMNMSMLQYFLDSNEPSSKAIFDGLKITQEHNDFCLQHMNKYPVFFITLKNLSCQNMQDFYFNFARRIAQEFQKFLYLLDSQTTTPSEKNWFASLLSGNATSNELKNSIQLLTLLLHKHHGVKPWVLIDEYDAPIHSAFQYNEYEECILFMKDLYGNALKDNKHLNKAVMTGILRVAKESIFSDLNNPEILTIVSPNCAHYFGVTEFELKNLLLEYELNNELNKVKDWYNGYQFGQHLGMHNPWSILNWLKNSEHQFKPYWLNTSSNELVRSLFFAHKEKLQDDIFKILSGETITIRLSEDMHFPSLQTTCSSEDYLTLLLHSGYLTVKKVEIFQDLFWYTLGIPNKEIKIIFSDMMDIWIKQVAPNLNKNISRDIVNALEKGDLKTFETHFSDVVLQVMSYHDFAKHPENAFHCFTAGFLSWLSHEYEVRSNRETGKGRADIYLLPKNNSLSGYIFELKIHKPRKKGERVSAATIARKLNLALKQIDDKKYETEFKARNISKVTKIALVFYKKKVWMKEFQEGRS